MLYEFNPVNNTKEYMDNIDRIEEYRDNLHINTGVLNNIISNDVIDGVLIEGNSLDRYEITMFLEEGITVRGKSFKDHIQAKNYNTMLERLKSDIFKKDIVECIIL